MKRMFTEMAKKRIKEVQAQAQEPYYSIQQQLLRYSNIAEKELNRVTDAKAHNREFIDMVERSKNLLLGVTPDREV